MGIRFSRLVRSGYQSDIGDRFAADRAVRAKASTDRMVFMSHKTGDRQAASVAQHIALRHKVEVYMAEWDDEVDTDSIELPDYIMKTIRASNGFLVNVTSAITDSMWIGYEIGGAHALGTVRAKIMYTSVNRLPSVVGVLKTLRSQNELDSWIITCIL